MRRTRNVVYYTSARSEKYAWEFERLLETGLYELRIRSRNETRVFFTVEAPIAKMRRAYRALDEEFAMIEMLLKARSERHMTQAELAQAAGMKQEVIARLESGRGNPTYHTLSRIAKALNKKVTLA